MTTAAQLVKVCKEKIGTFLFFVIIVINLSPFVICYVQPVSLELGGKSPIVVFEDVDLDKGWCAFSNISLWNYILWIVHILISCIADFWHPKPMAWSKTFAHRLFINWSVLHIQQLLNGPSLAVSLLMARYAVQHLDLLCM